MGLEMGRKYELKFPNAVIVKIDQILVAVTVFY